MAGSAVSGPIQTSMYVAYALTVAAATGKPTEAELVGAGKLVLAANLLERVVDIGDQGQASNPLNWVEFGEDVERSIAGPAGQSTFTFAVVNDDTKSVQKALLGKANGSDIYIAIQSKTGDSNITWDYIKGTIASMSKVRGTGAPNQTTIEIAVEHAFTLHKA